MALVRCPAVVLVAAAAAAAAAIVVVAVPARAGNLDAYFLGNEAALTGGAVFAVTGDSSALWYNPAGLGHIERNSVELTASAFVLDILHVPDMVVVEAEERFAEDGDDKRIRSVPTALGLARRLGKGVTGAIGLFVPVSDVDEADAAIVDDGRDGVRPGRLEVHIHREEEFYFGGLGVGWAITPRLRFGGALFFVYYAGQGRSELTAGLGTTPGAPLDFLVTSSLTSAEDTRLGLQGTLGVQWEPADGWHLGLVVRSPQMQVFRASSYSTRESSGGSAVTGAALVVDSGDETSWGFDMFLPVRVGLGVAYAFDGGWCGVEADIQPPLRSEDVGVDFALLWNVRAGARFRVSEKVSLGAGLFTDRSPFQPPDSLGAFDVDFYGASVGVELRSPHALADNPDPEALVFTTTFALRYAVGVGVVGSVIYEIDRDIGFTGQRIRSVDVIFHELTVHVGSAVLF